MADDPPITISHAGFFVFDLDRMVDFFTTVHGLEVSDRGVIEDRDGDTEAAFLSADPRDHHQLVMYSGRTGDGDYKHFNHISFRLPSLDRLREIHAALAAYPGVTEVTTMNHGHAWSVYFFAPEGNRSEVFVDTPWHVAQPFEGTLDLALSDDDIHAYTEKILSADPSVMPRAEWDRKMAAKFAAKAGPGATGGAGGG